MLCSLVLAAAVFGAPVPSTAVPESTPYTVIAQGVVELDAGSYAWSHTTHDLTPTELTIAPAGPAILLARGGGAAMVIGSDGAGSLLDHREATFSRDGVTWTAIAMAESGGGAAGPATQLDVLALVPSETAGDAALAIDGGPHDFELRYIELAAGEPLPPQTDKPAFLIVVDGTMVDPHDAVVQPGGTALLSNAFHAGEGPAAVVVAAIDPVLGASAVAPSTSIATTVAGNTPATTDLATTTTTTTTPPIDLDGDGLSDDEEAGLGTDHNDPDTDDDELTDGDEVNTHDTDPLSKDTDGDELPDASEIVTYGSDPLDPDSDDDGLPDIEPVNWGTGPTNPDTDGDGLLDGQEVNDYGSNPHQTDSDGDSLSDGDEVNTWESDPTNTDSDGDTLVDGEEVFGTHTSPADDDTDDDGVDDGTEAGNGTDPNDANDP